MATLQGKIIQAFEPRSGQSDRGQWMAQDFLLESFDQPYPRKCLFSVWGAERLQQFNIKEGDDVAVDIDIDAREYNGRYYNSLRAWRVNHIAGPIMQPTQENPIMEGSAIPPTPVPPAQPVPGSENDDLPF